MRAYFQSISLYFINRNFTKINSLKQSLKKLRAADVTFIKLRMGPDGLGLNLTPVDFYLRRSQQVYG